MSSVLFLISVTCGAILFFKLTGPDTWLVKGLREDRIGAVIATCFLGICAILLLALLYVLLPLIPASLAAAFTGPEKDLSQEDTDESFLGDITRWILLLGVPILAGYLLHWIYRLVGWVAKKTSPLPGRVKP